MALTERQKTFVREYLVDLNATQAAIRAGYSKKNATKIASENLRKHDIKKAVQEAIERRSERTEITADTILLELYKIGMSDAGDEQESHLKFSNKLRALELAGKHLGMFERQSAAPTGQVEDDPLSKALMEEAEKMDNANQS